MRLVVARIEHGQRRLVGMQHAFAQHLRLEGLHQWLQLHAAHAHPFRQGRARQRHASACKDALLAVQRQMIGVFGHQHLGQQARCGDAFVNDLVRYRRLR